MSASIFLSFNFGLINLKTKQSLVQNSQIASRDLRCANVVVWHLLLEMNDSICLHEHHESPCAAGSTVQSVMVHSTRTPSQYPALCVRASRLFTLTSHTTSGRV